LDLIEICLTKEMQYDIFFYAHVHACQSQLYCEERKTFQSIPKQYVFRLYSKGKLELNSKKVKLE